MIPDSLFDVYASPAGQVSSEIRDADASERPASGNALLLRNATVELRTLCSAMESHERLHSMASNVGASIALCRHRSALEFSVLASHVRLSITAEKSRSTRHIGCDGSPPYLNFDFSPA